MSQGHPKFRRLMPIDQYGYSEPKKNTPELKPIVGLQESPKGVTLKTLMSPFIPKSTPSLDPSPQTQTIFLLLIFLVIILLILGSAGYFMIQLINKWHSIEILHYQHKTEPVQSVENVVQHQMYELKRSEPDVVPPDEHHSRIITLSKHVLNRTVIGKCSGYMYSQRFGHMPSPENENTVLVKDSVTVHVNLLDSLFMKEKRGLTWSQLQEYGYRCCCTIKTLGTEALICDDANFGIDNINKAFQLQHDKEFAHTFLNYNIYLDANVHTIEWSNNWAENKNPKSLDTVMGTHFFKIEAHLIYPRAHANTTLLNDVTATFGDCVVVVY